MCLGSTRTSSPDELRSLFSRRGFLRAGAAVGGGLALAGSTGLLRPGMAFGQTAADCAGKVPAADISIQLYTLRNVMGADLAGTFSSLFDLGYRKVEHAGFGATENGTAAEFRAALDAAGLASTSGHQGIPYPFNAATWENTINDALTVGQSFIVNPSGPRQNFTTADWADYADALNQAGAMAKDAGMQFGYHNHDFEFTTPVLDDPAGRPYDIMLAETDPDLVSFELDLYWSWKAEQDPVELLEAHPDRFRWFHVKDMDADGNFADPGDGVIDFARIFDSAQTKGLREYTIERDDAGDGAIETARKGYELLTTTCFPLAAGAAPTPTEPAPAPTTEPTAAPAPTPAPSTLPTTGGGLATIGALGVTAAIALRTRTRA